MIDTCKNCKKRTGTKCKEDNNISDLDNNWCAGWRAIKESSGNAVINVNTNFEGIEMTKLEELIAEVRKIDPEAADYLVEKAPKLKSYCDRPDKHNKLENLFSWGDSKQRHKFWKNIDKQIKAKDKN